MLLCCCDSDTDEVDRGKGRVIAAWCRRLLLACLLGGVATSAYETLPRRVFTTPGSRVDILGRTPGGAPINACKFQFFSTQEVVDLSPGQSSNGGKYSYHGAGFERGECGITIKAVASDLDGVVTSEVRLTSGNRWLKAASALRVTTVSENSVAKFSISPSRAVLNPGDDITITCNADKSVTLCYFYLPGPQTLDLNQGHGSKSTDKYSYFGTGLGDGRCGVTLKNVDETLTGFVVCKVGQWPDGLNGPWHTDVLQLTVERGAVPSAGTATVAPPPTLPPPTNERGGCGRRNLANGLVSNGHSARPAEFPWHAAIYTHFGGVYNQTCGGTLITKSIVISAAHCFWENGAKGDARHYKVVLGKHHLDYLEYEPDAQRSDVAELRLDRRFSEARGHYAYDIAAARLAVAMVLDVRVNVACVDWEAAFEAQQLAVGQNGLVAGWGLLQNGSQARTLQYVELPWIAEATCAGDIPRANRVYYTPDKFCAGFLNQGVSVCRGDSGGGILFRNAATDRYYLRGVVSVSFADPRPGRCSDHLYSGFTRLSDYKRLIAPYRNQ